MTRSLPKWATSLIGAVVLIGLWWLLSVTVLSNVGASGTQAIPGPGEVLASYAQSGWEPYWRNFSVTLTEAAWGYLWGNGLALLLAAAVLVAPRFETVAMQLAVISYCIPIVAIGPLLLLILGVPAAGEPSSTAIFLAAMSVFFTSVVGTMLGLKSADHSSLDVVTVYGGGRLAQLRKVRVVAALPATLTALQIAVPAAFLGAILGEYLGKVEVGIGPAMMIAQQSLNAPRVWAIALASGAVALIAYAAVGIVARLAAPWAKGNAA